MTTLNIGWDCQSVSLIAVRNNAQAPDGSDYIQTNNVAVLAGDITEVHMSFLHTAGSTWQVKFKVWRAAGVNFEFIGQTEIFSIGGQAPACVTYAVNSAILGVQTGDFLGIWASTGVHIHGRIISAGSARTFVKLGDFVTDQTTASYSTGAFEAAIGLYNGIFTPPPPPSPIPDLPVRVKDPITGDIISLFTDYNYVTGGMITKKSYRSLTSNLHTQKYNSFTRYEVPIVQVNSEDLNNLRRWVRERVPLFFTENHSITTVDSGLSVKIKELNIDRFKKPYSQSLWDGELVLETL